MQFELRRELFASRYVWALAFAILVLAFWQALATFIPTADGETLPHELVPVILRQGRVFSWLLLKLLAPTSVIHPLDLLIAIIAFAGSLAIAVRIWFPDAKAESYAAVMVAAAFPTTVHMFTFSTVNMLFGVGALLSVLSVWCFVNRRLVLFCLLTVMAVGTYQGLLINSLVAYTFFILVRVVTTDKPIKYLVFNASVFVGLTILSALLYSVSLWAILAITGAKLVYVQDLLRPGLLLTDAGAQIASRTFGFFYDIMRGKADLFLDRGGLIGALQIGLLVAAIVNCIRLAKTPARGALAVLLLLAGVSATFLSIALMNAEIRYRTMLSAPLGMAGLAFVATMYQPKWLRTGIVCACALLALCYAQATTQMIRSAALSWQADREISQRIMQEIEAATPPPAPGQKVPFEMVGSHTTITPWVRILNGGSSTMGWSFYRYGESTSRAIGALSIMGYPYFRPINQKERLSIADRVLAMPAWPAKGSVAVIDGVAVVKFLESYTRGQVARFCGTDAHCASVLSRK